MMKVKAFLLNDSNVERNSYIWNMSGSMLVAFQSVIMLMILTRVLGLVEAGILTIAYANANLFQNIGKYGMRNFQVSDVKDEFNFSEYKASRIVTAIAMVAVSFIYVIYTAINNDYTVEKTQIILWMCLFRVVDVIEDVYCALYQSKNRLDIGAKIMTLRQVITLIVFGVGVVILKDLLLALVISTVVTTLLLVFFIKCTYGFFDIKPEKAEWKKVSMLLKVCFPLFAGAFLSFYIGNAPKYAIDAMLTDELQACYGFIAMPVFVVGLLNNFIFNPILFRMSILWEEGKKKEFVIRTACQVGIVGIITGVCILGAYLLGIPVLSWLYNTDLAPYKTELLILLLGGGFLGLSGLLNAVVTIMREQKKLMWGYGIVSILAYACSNKVVAAYGMMGAAVLYTVLIGALCVIFAGMFIYGVTKKQHQEGVASA